MTELLPLVRRMQSDAADSTKLVSDVLRLAKLIAAKLDAADALIWIDRELDGYPNVIAKELPAYRQITGTPEALNPYHGWQAIIFQDAKSKKACSYCPIGQALGPLEESLRRSDNKGTFTFDYPPELALKVQKAIGHQISVRVEIGFGSLWNIIDQVRNLILNWSLALEKGGVLGEAMTFTAKEKSEAAPITHQYFIQNVGVLGDVAGRASVQNVQSATASLDLAQIRSFIDQLKNSTSALPAGIQSEVVHETAKAEAALDSAAPDQGILRSTLTTIGNVCESAAGNLTAMGIAAAIRAIVAV